MGFLSLDFHVDVYNSRPEYTDTIPSDRRTAARKIRLAASSPCPDTRSFADSYARHLYESQANVNVRRDEPAFQRDVRRERGIVAERGVCA